MTGIPDKYEVAKNHDIEMTHPYSVEESVESIFNKIEQILIVMNM